MESGAQRMGKRLSSDGRLRLLKEMIMVVKFKENPTIDLDRSFRGIKHCDI